MASVELIAAAKHLSKEARDRIRRTIQVELSCQLYGIDESPEPEGVTDYRATFSVFVSEADGVESSRDAAILRELMRDQELIDEELVRVTIGYASLALGELIYSDLFDAFEARTADLATVAGTILDVADGELSADLMEQLEGMGNDVLIVDSVAVNPAWQGLGLGLLGTGLAINHLTRAAAVVALYPMDPEAEEEAARRAAGEALGRYWSRLGFWHFRDGIYCLDPNVTNFHHLLEELQKSNGA